MVSMVYAILFSNKPRVLNIDTLLSRSGLTKILQGIDDEIAEAKRKAEEKAKKAAAAKTQAEQLIKESNDLLAKKQFDQAREKAEAVAKVHALADQALKDQATALIAKINAEEDQAKAAEEQAKAAASETRIPTPKPAVADTKTVPAPKDTVNATPKKKKWAVMIDPGHGGKDPGASAKDGVHEKTIVLDIAKKLRGILEKDTLFTVMATRSEDKFLPLGERTALANAKGADLFVSIHCNAAHNKSARGTQVFFLAPARSDQARATAALENASIFLEEPSDSANDTDFIMADLIQNEFLRESSRLAVLIEESISKQTGLPERGPAGAGFYVLKGSFMPAVLVESAFLSNPDDAALLEKASFRKKVAAGIADGLRRFITELPK